MWGSLQLDWPFSLVVVVITITSRSHRSPSTDDCKYSTPACLSVCPSTVVGSLLYVAAIVPCFLPHITPSPLSQPHLSDLSHPSLVSSSPRCSSLLLFLPFCFLLFSSLTLSLCREDRSMVHSWLVLIGPTPPQQSPPISAPLLCCLFFLNTLLKQEVVLLSCAWCCLVSSHALCLFLRLWWGDSDLSVAWYLVSCPTPCPSFLTSALPPTVPTFLTCLKCVPPLPPTTHCGFVACIWSISTVQSSLSILYNTVLYVSADLSCWSVLVWFHVLLLLMMIVMVVICHWS